nr:reverse transcriptase domain-containing protein [Tanacetum cinerariifolium]
MKGLNAIVSEAVEKGIFKGVVVGDNNVMMYHLQYADGTILFREWNKENAKSLICILKCFEEVSMLKVNYNKSKIYGIKDHKPKGALPYRKRLAEGPDRPDRRGPEGQDAREETVPPLMKEEIEGDNRIVKGKEVIDDDLKKPFKEALKMPLTRRIIEFADPEYKMPNNIKLYARTINLEDHLSRLSSAANSGEWPMPVWCRMFQQTFDGTARGWGRGNQSGEGPQQAKIINMITGRSLKEKKRKVQEVTEKWMNTSITFPLVSTEDVSDKPLSMEVEVDGYLVRWIYVDGKDRLESIVGHTFHYQFNDEIPHTKGNRHLSHPIGDHLRIQAVGKVKGVRIRKEEGGDRDKGNQCNGGSTSKPDISGSIGCHRRRTPQDIQISVETSIKNNMDIFAWEPANMMGSYPERGGDELCPHGKVGIISGIHDKEIKTVLVDFITKTPDGESPELYFQKPETVPERDDTEEWTLFTNRAPGVKGSGAGLVLIGPSGVEHTYALRLIFDITNNEAEYEALLEINMGSCGMYSGPRVVVKKLIRHGNYWPTMHEGAKKKIKKCASCQIYLTVPKLPKTFMTSIMAPCLFYQYGIDILGPLPQSAKRVKFVIMAIDYFTKWIKAKPLARITDKDVVRFVLDNIICREMSFIMTYGSEAVIPAKIMPTYQTLMIREGLNEEELSLNLDLLMERREIAAI